MSPRDFRLRCALIAGLALAAGVAMAFVKPIPQDSAYHDFADRRGFLGIENFMDVVSNAPFLVVGLAGLAWLVPRLVRVGPGKSILSNAEHTAWLIFFAGALVTAAGSSYYHWAPGTRRLFWDRLPMTVAFMSLMAVQVMERVSLRAGKWLLGPLLVAGTLSVVYWRNTELLGRGDLRPYVLVQFFPILAIPLMLALFPPRYDRARDVLLAFLWYGLAKLMEELDVPVFRATGGLVSGHTIKHLLAGAGVAQLLWMVMKRRPVDATPSPPESEASLP